MTAHKGGAIATFHQMALLGKGKSILSCLQMEAYGADKIIDRAYYMLIATYTGRRLPVTIGLQERFTKRSMS